MLVTGVAALIAIGGFAWAVRLRLARASSQPPGRGQRFDLVSAGLSLVLLLAAFVYTGAAAVPITPGAELGIHLRNMSPTALVAPSSFCTGMTATARGCPKDEWKPGGLKFSLLPLAWW